MVNGIKSAFVSFLPCPPPSLVAAMPLLKYVAWFIRDWHKASAALKTLAFCTDAVKALHFISCVYSGKILNMGQIIAVRLGEKKGTQKGIPAQAGLSSFLAWMATPVPVNGAAWLAHWRGKRYPISRTAIGEEMLLRMVSA